MPWPRRDNPDEVRQKLHELDDDIRQREDEVEWLKQDYILYQSILNKLEEK